jgi:WhiB family transcriptional regulator, redox-sensing transcriptional regulator
MSHQLALPFASDLTDELRAELASHVVPDWQHQAACAGREGDLWFPDDADAATARKARRVCRGCPVLASCRAAGMLGDEHGVWGAATRNERRVLVDQLAYGLPVDQVLDPAHPIPTSVEAAAAA